MGGTNFANRLGGFEDLSETCFETVCRNEADSAKAKEKLGHGASKPYLVFGKLIPLIEGRPFPPSAGVCEFGPRATKMAILHMGKILKNGQNLELPNRPRLRPRLR